MMDIILLPQLYWSSRIEETLILYAVTKHLQYCILHTQWHTESTREKRILCEPMLTGCWSHCIWSWAGALGWCRSLWERNGPLPYAPVRPSGTECRSSHWSCWPWSHEPPEQCYESSVETNNNKEKWLPHHTPTITCYWRTMTALSN